MLGRWSGWGALPQVFDDNDDRWAAERVELRELLDDEAWNEARRTVLNAHYSDPAIAAAVWDAVARLGFEGGVLEPGCGSGNFMAYAPAGAAITGVEADRTTAAIARALYPDAEIHAGRFEDFDVRTPFDLAIGNVPFAPAVPHDARYNRARHRLHNYFLVKSLQLVRPGGLLVALTSMYTLDARNPAARRELAQHGDLLGALRLPNNAMMQIAGTQAVMDLLILRRRELGADPAGVTGWDRTVEIEVFNETTESTDTMWTNTYLAEHPDRVLGRSVLARGLYRSSEPMVRGDLTNLSAQGAEGLAAIVETTDLRYEPPPEPAEPADPATSILPGATNAPLTIGDVELAGDRLAPLRRKSFVASRTGIIYQHEHGELVKADVPQRTTEEVRRLIELRDQTVNLLRLEADDAPQHRDRGCQEPSGQRL